MSIFKKAKKALKKSVKKIKASPLKSGARIAAGVATGGLSEVARKVGFADQVQAIQDVIYPTNLKDAVKSAAIVGGTILGGPVVGGAILSREITPVQNGGQQMALGNVLGGLSGVLNTVSQFGGPAGTVAQIGSGFLSGFLPAQGPTMQASFPQSQFPVQTTMAAAPIIRGAGAAIANFAAPILAKMSAALGKNISLRAAMIIIRRLGKTLTSPAAIAGAVGLSLSELSQLLTASALGGSSGRRMNVGNVKALRRAHRRIKGFHKLCGENDRLKAPRRRASPKIINVKGSCS